MRKYVMVFFLMLLYLQEMKVGREFCPVLTEEETGERMIVRPFGRCSNVAKHFSSEFFLSFFLSRHFPHILELGHSPKKTVTSPETTGMGAEKL